MGYAVNDRVEISLFIDSMEYPLGQGGVLDFLQIGSSTKGLLPTIHFGITDSVHALDQLQLQDGIPLRVTIKGYSSSTVTYNFRKFNHKRSFNGSCYVYEVDGYWAAPLYWAGTTLAGITGSSSAVLSSIASTCGLKFNGITTNDTQLWMPRNRSYGMFAKKVASRGYVSDASYMIHCVDMTGTMQYQDVNNLPAPKAAIILNQMSTTAFTAIDVSAVAASGLNNQITGYWNTRYEQSTTNSTALTTAHDTVQFEADSRSPLFNTAVKSDTSRGLMTYAPIDVGNVHSNYERAAYQNMRFANLYNMDVQFLMSTPTNLDLLSTFTFSVTNEQDAQDTGYAGNYAVSARAIYIKGATYAEKLIGSRHGTNFSYVSG